MAKRTDRKDATRSRKAGGEGSGEGPRPFVHRIRVRWADCDPAAIAYTGRIPGLALQAIEAWWEEHAGIDWYRMNLDQNLGTPFVAMRLDFRSPVTPRHMLDCEVVMTRLGNRSISHGVKGYQDRKLCFEGEFTAVFVDARAFRTRTPPADMIRKIRAATGSAGS